MSFPNDKWKGFGTNEKVLSFPKGRGDTSDRLKRPRLTPSNITDTTVTLSWEAVDTATGYIVVLNGNEVYSGTNLSYEVTGLNPWINNTIQVRAFNVEKQSSFALYIKPSKTLSTPVVTLVSKTATTATVDWTDPDNLGQYKLYLDGVEVGSATIKPFMFEGLNPETAYLIGVSAGDGSVWSPIGNLNVTTDAAPIPVYQQPELTLVSKTDTTISLSSTNPDNLSVIELYQDGDLITSGAQNTWEVTSLEPETSYTFAVRAGDGVYWSPLSESLTVVTDASEPVITDPVLAYFQATNADGAYYTPWDKSTLFQDAAGTIPVVNDGDPVGLSLDVSGNGLHRRQTVSSRRPLYRTDGTYHWLQYDGVDDLLITDRAFLWIATHANAFAVIKSNTNSGGAIFGETGTDNWESLYTLCLASFANRLNIASIVRTSSNQTTIYNSPLQLFDDIKRLVYVRDHSGSLTHRLNNDISHSHSYNKANTNLVVNRMCFGGTHRTNAQGGNSFTDHAIVSEFAYFAGTSEISDAVRDSISSYLIDKTGVAL